MNTKTYNYYGLRLLFLVFLTGSVWATEPQPTRVVMKPLSAVYQIDLSNQPIQSVTFPVLEGKSLTVTILSGENLVWKLRLPDGTLIDKQNATNHGVKLNAVNPTTPYEKVWVFPTAAQFITLPNPRSGEYELQLDGSVAGVAEIIPVNVSTEGSGLRTGFGGPVDVILGEPVSLSVFLFENSLPITGATVQGKVLNSQRLEITTFDFTDDGQGIDHLAGDGLYTAFFAPQQADGYLISVNIQGTTSEGRPFDAIEGGRLVVNPPDINLTGTYRDQGVDEDGDGYFDYIRFEFDTQGPHSSGTYYLMLTLEAPNGKWIKEAGRTSEPTEPITVNVLAEDIKKLGMDGPYSLAHIILEHDNRTISRLENLGHSAAYRLDRLERRNTLIFPLSADRGIDIDGDGLFDGLEVVFGVDVLLNGYYEGSADLDDQQKNQLDSAYTGKIYLQRGFHNLTVTFSGEKIGQSGQNGPYVLNNVLVYPYFEAESSTSTLVAELGNTQHYTCSQFAGCQIDANALLERLISQFDAIALKHGLKKGLINSLRVKLLGAKRALEKNQKNAKKVASLKVGAFISEVNAQADRPLSGGENEPHDHGKGGKAIPAVDADLLIDAGRVLIEMIDLDWRKRRCELGQTKFCDE